MVGGWEEFCCLLPNGLGPVLREPLREIRAAATAGQVRKRIRLI